MEYLIGVGLAVAVCAFAMVSGFDRERVFYPTVLIVVAHYYILFAAMGSSTPVLALESSGSSSVSGAGGDRLQEEPLADCGRSRGTRNLRLLSSPVDSESGRPDMVARLLHVV